MSFGHMMQARREELGLGQRALADRLAVTQQTVSRWERSDHLPPPRQFLAIAAALELSPQSILDALGYTGHGCEAAVDGVVSHLHRFESVVLLSIAMEALGELRERGIA